MTLKGSVRATTCAIACSHGTCCLSKMQLLTIHQTKFLLYVAEPIAATCVIFPHELN